jgi:pyrroloquinoline-quinone synthase
VSHTIQILNQRIHSNHLLNHPFYVAWSHGELSLDDLRLYARRYFAHVRAFPAYLSEMHCRCTDLEVRRLIAANLADEEGHSPTHPDLWLDFAAGLGVSRDSVLNEPTAPKMQALIDTFVSVARMDTPLAAAGLYCYEKQIPDVAAAKIAGLQTHYGIRDEATTRYFAVHQAADVEHSDQWESILSRSSVGHVSVTLVADKVLPALSDALSEIYEACPSRQNRY